MFRIARLIRAYITVRTTPVRVLNVGSPTGPFYTAAVAAAAKQAR